MDRDIHFMSKQHVTDVFKKTFKEKVDKEVVVGIQMFVEKFVSDVLNRTALFTKHRESNLITSDDILFTVEKEFDYSFGQRIIKNIKPLPADEHISKLAEISKQK